MLYFIEDSNAKWVVGGAVACEQPSVTQGKSPVGTEPAQKSDSTSSMGSSSTGGVVTHS